MTVSIKEEKTTILIEIKKNIVKLIQQKLRHVINVCILQVHIPTENIFSCNPEN